jgi:hypothetical protein
MVYIQWTQPHFAIDSAPVKAQTAPIRRSGNFRKVFPEKSLTTGEMHVTVGEVEKKWIARIPLLSDGLFSVPASLGNLPAIQRGFFLRTFGNSFR